MAKARALAALGYLRPMATAGQRRRLAGAMWGHVGRTMTEFACLQRLYAGSRIDIVGAGALPPPGNPVVVAAPHLGSWEILSISVGVLGHIVGGIYMPQKPDHRNAIAVREREALGWIGFPATGKPVRDALRHLQGRQALVFYVDEYRDGVVRAPRLGRDIPLDGNILLAAKLAHREGAPLVFGECLRTGGARFRVTFTAVPLGDTPEATVERLDQLLDGAIRARPEQWYNLHAFKP